MLLFSELLADNARLPMALLSILLVLIRDLEFIFEKIIIRR